MIPVPKGNASDRLLISGFSHLSYLFGQPRGQAVHPVDKHRSNIWAMAVVAVESRPRAIIDGHGDKHSRSGSMGNAKGGALDWEVLSWGARMEVVGMPVGMGGYRDAL